MSAKAPKAPDGEIKFNAYLFYCLLTVWFARLKTWQLKNAASPCWTMISVSASPK